MVTYEWVVSDTADGGLGDVLDSEYFKVENLKEALDWQGGKSEAENGKQVLVLTRYQGSDSDYETQWAAVVNNKLPKVFDNLTAYGGAKVPKYLRKQYEKAVA